MLSPTHLFTLGRSCPVPCPRHGRPFTSRPPSTTTVPDQAVGQITNHSSGNSNAATSHGFHLLPAKGLDILNLPVRCADESYTPKKDSWRPIVQHWTEGDPAHGLHVPLQDWMLERLREARTRSSSARSITGTLSWRWSSLNGECCVFCSPCAV
jgi:hypothetical protein